MWVKLIVEQLRHAVPTEAVRCGLASPLFRSEQLPFVFVQQDH